MRIFGHLIVFLISIHVANSAELPDRITKDDKGRIHVTPLAVEERFLNPWTPELEEEFWTRCNLAIAHAAGGNGMYGNTFFENEKQSYPNAMMDFVAGNRAPALKFLQADDSEARHTFGVDFYPCFTLKGQMRKYFFFGQYLDPAYKEKMFKAAKLWTELDPIGRPHPLYGKGKGGDGWNAEVKGNWVDGRNTDNLRAMREVSVYLMAEETGNEAVSQIYKKKITRYVWSLYNIGMGEWDSENYHGHTMTGYINLYDFAKDPEVKLLGKAAMDWLCAAGAVKYYRGGFCGPIKRDYNKPVVWKGSAADYLGLYFGDCPIPNPEPGRDAIHFLSSAYRPPLAVVALARKEFKKPAEILASHPTYATWQRDGNPDFWDGEHKPEFHETTFFGNTYQIGTLPNGHQSDTNGFKMVAFNSKRGCDFFVAGTGNSEPTKISCNSIGGDCIAQYRNLVIWLNNKEKPPFQFLMPKSGEISTEQDITFIKLERTWLALHPINATFKAVDPKLTLEVNFRASKDKKSGEEKLDPLWPDEQIFTATGSGKFSGFALEIGESETHGDFEKFKQSALTHAKLDLHSVEKGDVEFTGSSGEKVRLAHPDHGLPKVWRNGKSHDWLEHWALYQPVDGGTAPISLGWKKGTLRVEAGRKFFTCSVNQDGKVTFENGELK